MNTSKGFGVSEMLVSIAILGIIMVGNMSMQASQASETRALSEKLAVLDLQRSLSGLLARTDGSSVCHGVMTNPLTNQNTTFNPPTTFPATSVLNLNNIPLGPGIGAPDLVKVNQALGTSNNIKIQSITVDFVSDQTAGTYPANLIIAFDPTSTVRPIKSLILPISIQTNPIPGSQSVKVSGCGANSSTSNANVTVLIPPYNPAMLFRSTNKAEDYSCPDQGAMTGLVINTTGTCNNNCNGDGPIISSIQAYCGGVKASGNSVLVGSNQSLSSWRTGAADFKCPQGQMATGLVVNTAGTCRYKCNGDGPIIKSIQIYCMPAS